MLLIWLMAQRAQSIWEAAGAYSDGACAMQGMRHAKML